MILIKEASHNEMNNVYCLVHDAYVSVGYIKPTIDGELKHYPHLDNIPETHVLVCYKDDILVGTNSWTRDGPNGLHTDVDFKKETDNVRKEGRVLGDSWRIATSPQLVKSAEIILPLIKRTLIDMVSFGIETALFTFNTKHEKIYKKLLNMSTIAYSDFTRGLTNVPAVLMRLDKEDIPKKWLT